jgi:hypothetical protein
MTDRDTIEQMAGSIPDYVDLDIESRVILALHNAGWSSGHILAHLDAVIVRAEQIRSTERTVSGIVGAGTFAALAALTCVATLIPTDAMAATADIAGTMSWTAAGVMLGVFLMAVGLGAYVWMVLSTIPDNALIEDGTDRSDVERRARNAGLQ